MATQNDILTSIADGVVEIAGMLRSMARSAINAAPAIQPRGASSSVFQPSAQQVGEAAGNPAASLAVATRGFVGAATATTVALQQMGGMVQGFVAALNPSAVLQFQYAMHNLSASLGVLFKPILDLVTHLAKQFNAALTPAFEKLQPIVTQISQAFGSVISVWIGAFASILQSLLPAFKFFADMVEAAVPWIQAFYAMISGLVKALMGLVQSILAAFGIDSKDFLGAFKDAVRAMADAALLTVAALLKLVDSLLGTTLGADFVKGVTEALGKGERRETIGAARNAQISGLAEFGASVARNALLAGVAGGATPEDQAKAQREKLIARLDQIAAMTGNVREMLYKLAEYHVELLVEGTKGKVYDRATKVAAGAAAGTLAAPGIGTVIGGIAGGMS